MKKKIAIISSIIIILEIVLIILIKLIVTNKAAIFIHSHQNYARVRNKSGYIIYNNGTIREFDEANTNKKLKYAKITDDELTQLKVLADLVKENYVSDDDPNYWLNPEGTKFRMEKWFDAGITEKKIYNSIDKKWITLYTNGDKMGYNDTEESKKIIELTNELYKKYIKTRS